MKKILITILLITIALSLVGCGKEKIVCNETSDNEATTETTTTEENIEADSITEENTEADPITEENTEADIITEENTEADIITEEEALTGIKNYCYSQNAELKDMESSDEYTIYWEITTNENSEIVVLYRSYTGAQIRYYIDPSSGKTYSTEFVPGITDEEEKTDETLNVRDYLE
ncbi:hypothetical protein SAMN02910369_01638 [Lachnospiraceae bacterium NE2001]|nr:hypothetical protein SAMN02910369_01638 [Lachnospiraceae bacterium NE2001]